MSTDPNDQRLRQLCTGDVVAVRPDGMLGFGGRADRQVKVRGFRIEPAEIEEAFRRQPGVSDVAVAARSVEGKTELLVFIVAPAPGAAAKAFAAAVASLPSQMRPRRMTVLAALPRLPNGKIDQLTMLELLDVPAPAAADTGLVQAVS